MKRDVVARRVEREVAWRDMPSVVTFFERAENLRRSAQIRQSHLEKQVLCLDCMERFGEERKALWVPTKTVKTCPHCSSCGRNLAVGRAQVPSTCECRGSRCGSKVFRSARRVDPFVEEYLPRFRELEEALENEVKSLVGGHDLWQEWAHYVRGIGEITLGRIMGHCDIKLLTKPSKMWAHAGLGLDEQGRPQRKRKGELVNYDPKLQSVTCILGESLLRAQGRYYDLYLDRKQRYLAQGFTLGHAHNRAFREMRKLCLDHIWRKWREVEDLPTREPYVMEYLGGHEYISPEEMMEKTKRKASQK